MRKGREEADVVVVGAGFAGLSAARCLAREGRVVVLEARDRVGGRVANVPLPHGHAISLGAQWMGPRQRRIEELASEYGVARIPTYEEGASVYERRDASHPEQMDPSDDSFAAIVKPVRELDAMAVEVPVEAPWEAPAAARWDAQTLEAWLDAHVPGDARERIEFGIEGFMGKPSCFSLLHGLYYSKVNGGFASFFGIGEPHDTDHFYGGAARIAEAMSDQLGDAVRLECVVREIAQDSQSVRVSGEGFEITASRAIVAMAPALVATIRFRPSLPAARMQLAQRVPVSAGEPKFNVVYDTPFWRAEGLSGRAYAERGPVQLTIDTTPPGYEVGILSGFARDTYGGPDTRERGVEARRADVLEHLGRLFGERAASPVDYVEHDWGGDEFSRGCVSVFSPGTWTGCGRALRPPVDRIHWAGTETAIEFAGQMEGAIRSGERAAREVSEATT